MASELTYKPNLYKTLLLLISFVWFANGLFCKILNLVPRHQLIVARILGGDHSYLLTRMIGIGELAIAVWVVTRFKSKLCAIVQVALVATMNIIEFVLAPDLLLFGKMNALFALAFIAIIYFTEFILNPKSLSPQ